MADLDRIFKAYDIRGRTDTGELDEGVARAVGLAFGSMVDEPAIAVGRDARPSSPGLAAALIDGITSAGVDVWDLGEVATDVVYHVAGSRDVAGVMVTASHNPGQYNGLKLCRAGAAPVGEASGLATVRSLVDQPPPPASEPGRVHPHDAVGPYIDHLLAIVPGDTIGPLAVTVDGGNGMAGVVADPVFDRIGARLDGLYLEPDGTFPNHPADPLQPENLADLVDRVRATGADLGVAFDGDADRAFFVDETGAPLSGSTTTALVARWFLAAEPGATVVHNLIVSRAVPELVAAAGGTPVRTRVGHSFIKGVMAETGAVFGGEHSGHYYFRDNYRADSGMLAMLVLLRVLTEDGRPLSILRRDVEPYAQSGERNYTVVDPGAALVAVEATFADHPIDRLDGLTVDVDEGWFNLRPSNTEPLLRLNAEAADPDGVEAIVDRVRSIIEGAT
ncbi:MAG: phosphomannomutase/phosphoglucomutase [Acidimicrobiia bacterium]